MSALARAFLEACKSGTHPSYRARINIIGHSRAGKTSLTRRLLGQKFQKDVESTDGIETHRIEFDLNESPLGLHTWAESDLKTEELSQKFTTEVLQMKERQAEKDITHNQVKQSDESIYASSSVQQGATKAQEVLSQHSTQDQDFPENPIQKTILVKENQLEELKAAMDQKCLQPSENSKQEEKGVLRLWDFGGQTEFYATHHMFLDADAVNIIVMDLSKPFKSEIATTDKQRRMGVPSTQGDFLSYWLRSIEAKIEEAKKKSEKQKQEENVKPKVILVFTHLDMSTIEQKEQFVVEVKETIAKYKKLDVSEGDMFYVDNNRGSEEDFRKLRSELHHKITSLPTWGMLRPVKWLQVEAAIRKKLNGDNKESLKYIHIEAVQELVKDYQMDVEELNDLLLFLHKKGDIVFCPDEALRHLITLDPQWLVDIFKTLITGEEFMMKRLKCEQDFLKSAELTGQVCELGLSGKVALKTLTVLWQGEDVEFLTKLLEKFGLIVQLHCAPGEHKKFLVPSMLPQPKNSDWQRDEFTQNMCLAYKSTHTAQFDELFPLDTFPKLVAAFSQHWLIRQHALLSFRHVSFDITGGGVLALSQSHRSTIAASIWFNPAECQQNPMNIVLETRATLASALPTCGIPCPSCVDVICPHWTLNDYHICTVEVIENTDETTNITTLQPVKPMCACHSQELRKHDFNEIQQLLPENTQESTKVRFSMVTKIVLPSSLTELVDMCDLFFFK